MAWTMWAAVCVIWMVQMPGGETIPYHLGWAGFALAFGLGAWTRRQLVMGLTCYTLASGAALERSWILGRIGWDETTEIPLMFLLAILMVWHVHRRQIALAAVTRFAARESQASRDRERLMRLTSHELRTPLTIARGYMELLEMRALSREDRQDLNVVSDELDRLSRVSDRLIRMIGLQGDLTSEMFDVDQLMAQVIERWQVVADRRWTLAAGAGHVVGSPERMRTCLDTLVENAIRYTSDGDVIRLVGSRQSQCVVVGVADGGAGLTSRQITAINAGELSPAHAGEGTMTGTADRLAGTGLGLSIVREAAHARGGMLHASHAPEGGAALMLTYPIDPLGAVVRPVPRLAPSAPVAVPDLPSQVPIIVGYGRATS